MRLAFVSALILAVTVAAPVAAQDRLQDKLSANTTLGAAITGDTTPVDVRASAGIKLNDFVSLVGEWGTLSDATFRTLEGVTYKGIGGQHVNGNLVFTAPQTLRLTPYGTFGAGTFVTSPGPSSDKRHADLAFNMGGGVKYDINKYLSLSADYRRFWLEWIDIVGTNRFTVGATFGIR